MTTPKKPEWFELAESDGGKPRTPVKSGARGVLLALPLMLIGAGVVVAQTADDSPAVAESVTSVASVASAAPQVNDAPASSAIKSSSVKPIQPAIATPPTGGGDDDDDDDDDDYDDDEDEEDDEDED
jgi:hypothetical protein